MNNDTYILTHVVRDNSGMVHKRGEEVKFIHEQIRLGIHDKIMICQWMNGTRVVLLPDDLEPKENT